MLCGYKFIYVVPLCISVNIEVMKSGLIDYWVLFLSKSITIYLNIVCMYSFIETM